MLDSIAEWLNANSKIFFHSSVSFVKIYSVLTIADLLIINAKAAKVMT
jgi:hypothetical protein